MDTSSGEEASHTLRASIDKLRAVPDEFARDVGEFLVMLAAAELKSSYERIAYSDLVRHAEEKVADYVRAFGMFVDRLFVQSCVCDAFFGCRSPTACGGGQISTLSGGVGETSGGLRSRLLSPCCRSSDGAVVNVPHPRHRIDDIRLPSLIPSDTAQDDR